MITLYGMSSPNVSKIAIMLEETGLIYETRHVDLPAGEQFTSEFLAASPNNKVPYIVDHAAGISLGESGAILIYLAEKTSQYLPQDVRARAHTLYWLMVQLTSIGPNFGQLVHFTRRAPEGQEYSTARFATEMRRCLRVLETRLADHAFLAGAYSIADMATYPWIKTITSFVPANVRPDLAEYPSLQRWFTAIAQRPAVISAQKAVDELQKFDIAAFTQATPEQLDKFSGRGPNARV